MFITVIIVRFIKGVSMNKKDFFLNPQSIQHKRYEALRMYFVDKVPAKVVANKFGLNYRTFTTIITEYNKALNQGKANDFFFVSKNKGRKKSPDIEVAHKMIIQLRNSNLSVAEIKTILDGKNISISEKTIYNIINDAGFKRLPRRTKNEKMNLNLPVIKAEKSIMLDHTKSEDFKSMNAGNLSLMPIISHYNIDKIIEKAGYPATNQIDALNSVLSFISLKASNVRRYSADNLWCMERGSGLFAGLNVLPKAAWFSSYSDRVTSDMNKKLLLELSRLWNELGLLGDTSNLDFTTIPYWGDSTHLENNWSGKRNKALPGMLAVLSQDSQSGIVDYGDANILHKDESAVVLEFLDFRKTAAGNNDELKYLVFDSKFTNYENLSKINENDILFLTIRRRGKNIVKEIESVEKKMWKTVRVKASGNKGRTLKILEDKVRLQGYKGEIRQICITGNGKLKPAILITNDFQTPVAELVRKYARRWLIEKEISEQISFFHLNNVSSSMVIKVDFDMTMSILTHNIFKLLAHHLERYENLSDQKIYEMFLYNSGDVSIENDNIIINLKKKRILPLILETMNKFANERISWLGNKKLIFQGASYS